jgi:hypothetical protein
LDKKILAPQLLFLFHCRHRQVSYKLEDILNKILVRRSQPENQDDDNGVDGKRGGIFFQEDEIESENQQVLLQQVIREQEVGFENDGDDLGSEGLPSNFNTHDNNEKESIRNNNLRHFHPRKTVVAKKLFNETQEALRVKQDGIQKEKDIENHARLADLYYVVDLFAGGDLIAKLTPQDNLNLLVNLSGVRMVKLIPRKTSSSHQHLPSFRPNAFQ